MGTGAAPKIPKSGARARAGHPLAETRAIIVCALITDLVELGAQKVHGGVDRYVRAAASALFRKSFDAGVAVKQAPRRGAG